MQRECLAFSFDKSLPFRFLLASLQLQHVLRAKGEDDMREALNELPSTPDAAFEEMLRRIEQQDHRSAATAIRTLTWCYYSRRPLQMDELRHALVVEDDHHLLKSNGKSATSIVDSCLSFVTHDQSTREVRFIHPSVQRWFKREPQNHKLLPHAYLAKTCLTYLNFDVFDDPTKLDADGWRSGWTAEHIGPYPFYRYAAQFWSDHTRDTEQEPAVQRSTLALLEAKNRRTLMLQTDALIEDLYYKSGRTALHVAASYGLAAICQELLAEDVRYILPAAVVDNLWGQKSRAHFLLTSGEGGLG